MKHILLEAMLKHMENKEIIRDRKHDFIKNKLCLTNLVTFYDGMTTSVNKEIATVVICLDFYNAFDMVLHNILATEWRCGLHGLAVRCMRN
ncbi:hypothetical protein WISP_105221 [Willisornis vidua]|uniref:Reverse transcriptase domain-containing protein n=1 Tax=Willisornis vidua TaxID=1566151 RepID=A0ABQ9D360_9PASS|nr:hypothetical protein WISP_105221 [Willisornis vidua]